MKDCPCSLAPTDEELIHYALDGTALSVAATEHVAVCVTCQQRLEHYCSVQHFLLTHLYRHQCPGMSTLGLYCMCLLPADKMHAVREHLAICPLCQSDVAETCQALNMSTTSSPWPPGVSKQNFSTCTGEVYQPSPLRVHPAQYRVGNVSLSLHITYDEQQPVLCGLLENCTEARRSLFPAGVPVSLFRVDSKVSSSCSFTEQDEMEHYARSPYCSTCVDQQGKIMLPGVLSSTFFMIIYLPETALVIEDIQIM